MKTRHQSLLILVLALSAIFVKAQNISPSNSETTEVFANATSLPKSVKPGQDPQKIVVITGVRFTYPLVQRWIDDYNKENPDVQIVIESRGSADPAKYDILVEVYDKDNELLKSREYVYVARYAILPVANSKSAFAKVYGNKGLNKELISQLYFHDIFADKDEEQEVKAPYTIYTRLQKAGAPIVFTKYFGYEHKNIKGTAIAGSDEHLLKAVLRDSTGVSYLPLTLIYDHATKKPIEGLTVLPVDLNGNGKINDEEKFYDDLTKVTQQLEEKQAKDINNIPVEYINVSVDKANGSPEAIKFLRWVIRNGQNTLHDFGYLKPEPGRFEPDKFEDFAAKRLE